MPLGDTDGLRFQVVGQKRDSRQVRRNRLGSNSASSPPQIPVPRGNRVAKKPLAEMPPAKGEPWTLELSAYGFGGTASGMLRSTSLDRSRYQIPGAMGC